MNMDNAKGVTPEEIEELRACLRAEVERYGAGDGYITKKWAQIGASGALALTSEAELLVFDIPREAVPALQTAYCAFLVLTGIMPLSPYEARTTDLLKKARLLVPPMTIYGHEVPFRTGMLDLPFFLWFAKTFLDIPNRHAAAIFAKHEYNTSCIATYADER